MHDSAVAGPSPAPDQPLAPYRREAAGNDQIRCVHLYGGPSADDCLVLVIDHDAAMAVLNGTPDARYWVRYAPRGHPGLQRVPHSDQSSGELAQGRRDRGVSVDALGRSHRPRPCLEDSLSRPRGNCRYANREERVAPRGIDLWTGVD